MYVYRRCILNSETKFYHILAGKGVLRTSLHFSGRQMFNWNKNLYL